MWCWLTAKRGNGEEKWGEIHKLEMKQRSKTLSSICLQNIFELKKVRLRLLQEPGSFSRNVLRNIWAIKTLKGKRKNVKTQVNILLPVSVWDTDGNIITRGACGGTRVWIANQEGLLSGLIPLWASGETPHCFWLGRLHSAARPSCPIPTVPSHCAAQSRIRAHTPCTCSHNDTSSFNQMRLDPSLSFSLSPTHTSARRWSFLCLVIYPPPPPFCFCFRKEKQIPKQLRLFFSFLRGKRMRKGQTSSADLRRCYSTVVCLVCQL